MRKTSTKSNKTELILEVLFCPVFLTLTILTIKISQIINN